MEKTVALVLVVLACGFLNPSRRRPAGAPPADKAASGKAAGLSREAILNRAAALAVPFVANAGRFDKQVRFSADLFSGRFFLTDKELVYSLRKRQGKKNTGLDKGLAVKEFFIDDKGDRVSFVPSGEDRGVTKVSYFRGNDPSKWQSDLASFNSVSLGDVYPGIQVKLKASGKNVEKFFYVNPGSDVAGIRIGVAGVEGLKIVKDGGLLFKNSLGELAMRAPVAWQEIDGRRRDVKVGYRLLGKRSYGFAITGGYDKNQPLVIDPELDTLVASTYLGGGSWDKAFALALDGEGNVYLAGSTMSSDFPTTKGACDRENNAEKNNDYYPDFYPEDVFVSKLNGDLTKLLASTYLGGEGGDSWELDWDDDYANSLALDVFGNVYIAGWTHSLDFPTTPGAYDRIFSGDESNGDGFVSMLDGELKTLMASTYFGGQASETVSSLAVDGPGNVYLTGKTSSKDFPTTEGAYDRTYNGGNYSDGDIFVSKLNRHLTRLLASTFLGGSEDDQGHSLAIGGSGDVYLAGITESWNFPVTSGAYDRSYNSDNSNYSYKGDVFVSKLNGNLTALLAATFLGGKLYENAYSLALDSAGDVYLAGGTTSTDFPTTPGAYDREYNGDDPVYYIKEGDVFISKFNGNLSRLLASTFLGGGDSESGASLALDEKGNVFLTGWTFSEDFPTTPGSYDRINEFLPHWKGDVFISKMDSNLSKLSASTFLGGGYSDSGHNLVIDSAGKVYLAGIGTIEFPTTPGAYDQTGSGGSEDVFVAVLNGKWNGITLASPNGGESWVAGTAHDIAWAATGNVAEVRIELSTDNGTSWSEVAILPARTHAYPWTVPNTPSRQCRVRISDVANAAASDASDAVFTILMNIDLLAERREVRAFSVLRHYGEIQFLADIATQPAAGILSKLRKAVVDAAMPRASAFLETGESFSPAVDDPVQVAHYRIMRRQGDGDFALLRTIVPSELKNNQFIMHDKYLEKAALYTYRIEAYNAAGQLIGISAERTI